MGDWDKNTILRFVFISLVKKLFDEFVRVLLSTNSFPSFVIWNNNDYMYCCVYRVNLISDISSSSIAMMCDYVKFRVQVWSKFH